MRNYKKRSKYGVDQTSTGKKNRTVIDRKTGKEVCFDSLLEKKYYEEVIIPGLKDGTIKKVELQKKYQLQPSFKHEGKTIRSIDYISDFTITYADGSVLVVDTKGRATADAQIKRKLMHYVYPDLHFVWMAHTVATGWIEYDALQKIRREKRKVKANEGK